MVKKYMKSFKNISFLFGLLFLLLLMPLSVSAETSPKLNLKKQENFVLENIEFHQIQVAKVQDDKQENIAFIGGIENHSEESLPLQIEINVYNEEEVKIASSTLDYLANASSYQFYQQLLDESTLVDGYTFEDASFYQISVEPSSKDFAQTKPLSFPSTQSYASQYDYIIDSYDIHVTVNEDNTFDIVETIQVYFNKSKHGIYRNIPYENHVIRTDGTESYNIAKISQIKVNNTYTLNQNLGYYTLQIGNENKMITGEQTYVISYHYNIGKDPLKDVDEFYFNLIGNNWNDTVIGNVTFDIDLPKEFDSNKLYFYHGEIGSGNSLGIFYEVNGNHIHGYYDGTLNPKEALTVRLELPEGYFVGAGIPLNPLTPLMFIIPIVGLLISIFLWYKYGRDDEVYETIEFYPPKGCNSLDTAFYYYGECSSSHVTSLLIYLANKGYVQINELPDPKSKKGKTLVEIVKLKDYDGDDENEYEFMQGLFKSGDRVKLSDLRNSFYKTTDKILKRVNSSKNVKRIFDEKASSKKIVYGIFIVLSILLIFSIPCYEIGGISGLIFSFAILIMFMPIIVSMFLTVIPPVVRIIFIVFSVLVLVPITFFSPFYYGLLMNPLYMWGFIVGIIALVGMLFFLQILPKRTPFGNEMFGKVSGFRKYLLTVEKGPLETMVSQDPTYFYQILPFAYALGVSKKWIKKFEEMQMQPPTWYYSTYPFTSSHFVNFMSDTISSASASLGSSSSGGGVSGGGSGGGGGGSW